MSGYNEHAIMDDQALVSHDGLFSYDAHCRHQAVRMATGVAIIVLGFAFGAFLTLLPQHNNADTQEVVQGFDKLIAIATKDLVVLPAVESYPLSFIEEILMVITGYTVIHLAQEDATDFKRAFPHIEPLYTHDQQRRIVASGVLCVAVGLLVIAVTHGLLFAFALQWPVGAFAGSSRLGLVVGGWLVVYGAIAGSRTDLFHYKFHVLHYANVYELGRSIEGRERETLLAEKRLCDISFALTHMVGGIGVIGALVLYFLPSFRTTFFWVPLALAFVLIVLIIGFVVQHAKRTYEPNFD